MVASRFGSGRYDITNNENVIIILEEKNKDITFYFRFVCTKRPFCVLSATPVSGVCRGVA